MTELRRRALISVFDNRMLVDFARGLFEYGYEVVATPETRQTLLEGGIPTRSVSDLTGLPDLLGGRIKFLHPAIFSGILARRSRPEHMRALEERKWTPIDMVVANLAPVHETMTTDEVIERIDIGGSSLIRAAAKNSADVITIVDPNDYDIVLKQLKSDGVSLARRRLFAMKAFAYTATYDQSISQCFAASTRQFSDAGESAAAILPQGLSIEARWRLKLRHGDNPHQAAALYQDESCLETSIANADILSGGELNFRQVSDLDLALEICKDFDEPLAVFVRHGNPCGLAKAEQLPEAYLRAQDADPLAIAGSVVAVNRAVDDELAPLILQSDVTALAAPAYRSSVLDALTRRKSLTLLRTGPHVRPPMDCQIHPIVGGFLVQDRDLMPENRRNWRVATELEPTPEDLEGLVFAWRVVKWVRSYGAAVTDSSNVLGLGCGQTSLVDAARLALQKAGGAAEGAYLAADEVFGLAECLDLLDTASEAGIRGIIQPGGGSLDSQAARAADERGLAMVYTGRRHLRH